MSELAPWQQTVLDAALAALAEGRLGHALLLVGPPRMGKGEVAAILAARLLCATPDARGLACGRCRGCQLLAAGTHGDFRRVSLEPTEKGDKLRTEITVDQVRRLGQWFALTPQWGGAQVALIEPADLMNTAAANALLKTLEEPSPGRFLLLVSSRPGRLPATIRSRCQRLEFRMPAPAEAGDWLRRQGRAPAEIAAALAAARGHPGLAQDWLENGGLALRRELEKDLAAIGAGRTGAVEAAQRWLGDEHAELRLRFAADLAQEAAARTLGLPGAAAGDGGDFDGLSAWYDAVNRLRDQLRAPLRHDLVLAGLLREWRKLSANGRGEGAGR